VLYRNGVVVASQPLGVFTPKTAYALCFGFRPAGGANFSGSMDEMSLYSRALSGSEITALYSAASMGKCVPLPTITSQPQSQAATLGNDASFSVAATTAGLLGYQWRFNGTNQPGATNRVYTILNVQATNAGVFSVLVSNLSGGLSSSNATLTVTSPVCVSSPSNMVALWQGEADTTDSVGVNDGSPQGAISFANGKVGQALTFDGISGHVKVPASASLDVGAGTGLTVEGWIQPFQTQSVLPLVEWRSPSGVIGLHFWINQPVPTGGGSGSLFANLIDSSGAFHVLASTSNLLSTTTFNHVALTYDKPNGVAVLYLNGSVVASANIGSFILRTSSDLYLGARITTNTQFYFVGKMDEMAVYNRPLVGAEIVNLYNSSTLGRCSTQPTITVQPTNQSVPPGTNVTFSASVAGSRPLDYHWQYNGSMTVGTNAALTLTNVQPSKSGNYSLFVSNPYGSTNSSGAILKVNVVLVSGNAQPLTNSQYSLSNSVTIQMQNAYSNGFIFYTLDGSTPTIFSAMYSAPFVVSTNCVIRTLGFSPDFFESALADPITLFFLPLYSITATTAGGGTISLNPTNGFYVSNTIVTLQANPSPGWTFLQWLDDASGTNSSTPLLVTRNMFVRAIFGTTLNTTAAPAGSGLLVLNPSAGLYPYGTVVSISALPQPANFFAFWGNAANGGANPLLFPVTNANPIVSSLFTGLGANQASLAVVPVGRGSVSVSPPGNAYSLGQMVNVTASPQSGQSFLGWSGDATGPQNPLSVSMTQSKIIYGNFTRNGTLAFRPLNVRNLGEGFELILTGEFGAVYRLDVSTNLADWTPLVTMTNTFGVLQYIDMGAASNSTSFYRAVVVP
jgi:hypothetical protein